jgi:hypothetical protein
VIDVVVLCAHTTWLPQALDAMAQIPEPKRGPRRSNIDLLNRYANLVAREVALNVRRKDQVMLNIYHIRRERIKRELGQYSLNNKRYFWLHWFEQQPWGLYSIVAQGNNINEENTQVTLNWDFLTHLDLEAVPKEMIIEHYDQLNSNHPDMITGTPVDLKSLQVFIDRTREALRTGQRWSTKQNKMVHAYPDWIEKAKSNLKQAVQILKLADTGELIQPMQNSAFGRMYLGGINLQNCSKTVRHAALGHCYSIDFSVCSNAWRLYTAQQIDHTFTAPHTLRLIKDKQQFRWDVARLIADRHTARAKTVITSIGFGASINSKPWPSGGDYEVPAIKEIIGDYEIEQLQTSTWFMEFIKEQDAMTEIICNNMLSQLKREEIVDCVKDRAGRIQRSKIMAYMYQHAEMDYLADVLDYITERFGRDEILLTVHDCVYLKHSVNMAEVNSRLQQLNPYLVAERTEHWGHFDKDVNPLREQTAEDPHKQQAEAFLGYWRNKQQNEGHYTGSYAGYYD